MLEYWDFLLAFEGLGEKGGGVSDDDRARVREGVGGEQGRNRPDPPSFFCFALFT